MAFLCSSLPSSSCSIAIFNDSNTYGFRSSPSIPSRRFRLRPVSASHVCAPAIDRSTIVISETASEDELWAAACLRVRTFNEFNPSAYNIQVSSSFYSISLFWELLSCELEQNLGISLMNATPLTLEFLVELIRKWKLILETCMYSRN